MCKDKHHIFLGKNLSFLLFKRTLWLEPVDKFREEEINTSQDEKGKTQLKFVRSSCYLSWPEGLRLSNTSRPGRVIPWGLIFATTGIKDTRSPIFWSLENIKRPHTISLEQGSNEGNCVFTVASHLLLCQALAWTIV